MLIQKNKSSLKLHEFMFLSVLSGETTRMNLFQSVTSALDITLEKDPSASKLILSSNFD